MLEFLAVIRKLASTCEFGEFLNDALRDRLVCGCRSEAIQKRLLSEKKLTLANAVDLAHSMETAVQQTKELRTQQKMPSASANISESVNTVTKKKKFVRKSYPDCTLCGKKGHSPEKCYFNKLNCHKCGQLRHSVKVCTSETDLHKNKPQKKYTNIVDVSTDGSDRLEHVYAVGTPRVQIMAKLNGRKFAMDIDTGASVSIVNSYDWAELGKPELKPANLILRTYSGALLEVLGICSVSVEVDGQHANLPIVVIKGNGPALLGRNWLQRIQIDWKKLFSVNVLNCAKNVNVAHKVLSDFPDLFAPGLVH